MATCEDVIVFCFGARLWVGLALGVGVGSDDSFVFVVVRIPGYVPLDCTASLHTSSRSPEVPHSVPCRPEAPTHLGVSSTPQSHKREPARGSAPLCRTDAWGRSGI